MSLLLQALNSTRGRVVLGVIAAYGGFQLWLTLAAPGKISPELAGTSDKLNVQIELPFTPERFHVLAFQQYGRVSGTDDRSIELRGVKRRDLPAIARPYWVTSVGPIKEGG
ncbi:hypothetical protein BRAO375_1350005 [Bradyrhizobium sp. ORS 375]|uniref:hypothetical protein n=1 Tax=Bradyrhizobium sp. (strain ORS 375) TaxID=566679 RepID=UPI000240A6D5|nr:hypothetical protein [Bradyrhizobium sp. ORS 375]CCD91102.1 hypothetical protein BRAO375_1350005 [Bradyrhizobium sp. ORS 375]